MTHRLSALCTIELLEENYTTSTISCSDHTYKVYMWASNVDYQSSLDLLDIWNRSIHRLEKIESGSFRKLFSKEKGVTYEVHYQISGGRHVSSNGFVNYTGGYSECDLQSALKDIYTRFPGAVVLDGEDNFFAKDTSRTSYWIAPFLKYADLIGTIHTGISGLAKSGVIISREMYELMPEFWKNNMKNNIQVYRHY